MSRYRIPREDFINDDTPTEIGEQVRMNHVNCPAGVDNKRRLYVKCTEATRLATVVAYCHNCGGSGIARVRGVLLPTRGLSLLHNGGLSDSGEVSNEASEHRARPSGGYEVSGSSSRPTKGEVKLPRDAMFSRTSWRPEARTILSRYGLTEDYPGEVFYSESKGKLGIVIYDDEGYRERIIYRRLFEWDTDPKYKQYRSRLEREQHRKVMSVGSDVLVLTEDWISAKKINKAGFDSYPLLTTSLQTQDIVRLTDRYSHVIVWLDNDNPVVKKNRDKIVSNLSLLISNVNCITDMLDPKHYPINQLQEVINSC